MKTLLAPQPHAHIESVLYSTPWAITEPWYHQICSIYEAHLAGKVTDFEARAPAPPEPPALPFDFVNNVAIINVAGPLLPKANLFTKISGATSFSEIKSNLQLAQELTPSAVILNFDTPGGSVMGLADLCTWLREYCSLVSYPVLGLVNPLCASAGCMIASQCDLLYSTDGGLTGSIGVIGRVDNYDRAQRNAGNDPVVLRSHELKAPGAGGPITPNQLSEMQRSLLAHLAKFKEAVIRGRPDVNLDQVATGQMWMGVPADGSPSAQDMGLIDGISTLEKLINQYGSKI